MSDVTRILSELENGDSNRADELLVTLYGELRRLAAAKLAKERSGISIQATALVHEAYLKLASEDSEKENWNGRRHFFGAAAEAMRRILVDRARRNQSLRRGGNLNRIDISFVDPEGPKKDIDLIALDEALDRLADSDARACSVVKLRHFAGLTVKEIADALELSVSTVEKDRAYARAWLRHCLRDESR